MLGEDIFDRLRIDPGKRTIGELFQDREAAAQEIRKLRSEIERLRTLRTDRKERADKASDTAERHAFRPGTLIKLTEVCELTGVSRSTIYKWVEDGTFPAPVHVSERAVRWRIDEIEEWRNKL